jgi:hypothetical protein
VSPSGLLQTEKKGGIQHLVVVQVKGEGPVPKSPREPTVRSGIISTGYVRGFFTLASGSRYVNIEVRSRKRGDSRSLRKKGVSKMVMGAKVFIATKAKDREELGEVLTRWIRDNPRARILDKIVTQSSDSEFHCLTITVFYEIQAP